MSDLLEDEEELGKVYDAHLIRRLWTFIAPYKGQVFLTLFMVVPLFLAELAPAWIIKAGLDRAFGGAEPGEGALGALLEAPARVDPVLWLAFLYLAVALIHTGLTFAHMLLMVTTGQSAMRDLRRAIFDRIQALHLGFFDRYPVGRLVTRASNDVENLAEAFSAGIVALITDVFKMIGFAVALYLVQPELALASFAVVPVLAALAIFFRLKMREAFRAIRVRIARINAHIQETITGMKVVQLFTREARNMREFDAMNADHRDAWKQSIHYEGLLFAAVEVATGITVAIIIWRGSGLAEPGILFVFIDWMRRFFMPLREISAKYSVMQSAMASCERIFQLLDTDLEVSDPPAERAAGPRPAGEARGSVCFENVWFAYDAATAAREGREPEWVLRDLSFEVAPGERVAFVGATGAGKTTIIKLLSRFYEVSRGRILVDGQDIRTLPQRTLRRRVATVLQDVFLFSGTVEENIALGREGVDEFEVTRAARAVEADAFIRRLPRGYATEVRARGTNFSAGQRQLLSLARALALQADILVLYEATCSIDTETEALIQRGIHVLMEDKTAIAIAHRLSTIRDVDRIYVLSRGRLAESGTHDELMALRGVYERLYRLQTELQDAAVAEGTAVPA